MVPTSSPPKVKPVPSGWGRAVCCPPCVCWQDLPPAARPGLSLSWAGKYISLTPQWKNGRKGFVKHRTEGVNECDTGSFQGTWKWGQQCSPAHPRLSPKNLLLPLQGDFGGEDAISALPETRVAVCLHNKALLFSNEPPSKSFCPQIKTGTKDYMLAQSPAIPLPSCLVPNITQCFWTPFMMSSWWWRPW